MCDTIEEAIETLEGFISEATDEQVHVMVALACGIDYENQNLDVQTYVDMLWGTFHAMSYADMCVVLQKFDAHSIFQNPKITLLIADWEACTQIKIFEMPVINKSTGESDWIVWNVHHNNTHLYAVASENLPTERVEWDECFSLDEHLQALHDACSYAIDESNEWDHNYSDEE